MTRVWGRHESYFVLQSLREVPPSISLHDKICTKYRPVPLCIARFAQNTSQYYFVLQSWHKAFPALLCTTKPPHFAHTSFSELSRKLKWPWNNSGTGLRRIWSRLEVYLVLQSLHKIVTSPYYKHCTKYFPALLCTTSLAQNTFRTSCMMSSTAM
jgi:hypothetical protein